MEALSIIDSVLGTSQQRLRNIWKTENYHITIGFDGKNIRSRQCRSARLIITLENFVIFLLFISDISVPLSSQLNQFEGLREKESEGMKAVFPFRC